MNNATFEKSIFKIKLTVIVLLSQSMNVTLDEASEEFIIDTDNKSGLKINCCKHLFIIS